MHSNAILALMTKAAACLLTELGVGYRIVQSRLEAGLGSKF